jgi:hypothetical protein
MLLNYGVLNYYITLRIFILIIRLSSKYSNLPYRYFYVLYLFISLEWGKTESTWYVGH